MEKLKMIAAMAIFGTIGIVVQCIPLPSAVLACARAIIGACFIGIVPLLLRRRPNLTAIRRNASKLFLSGAFLGLNWIFLFEAYRHTTVAVATLCYYMAPVFVILLSPVVLKVKLTPMQIGSTFTAVLGAVLISGVLGQAGGIERGVWYGLTAAFFYCSVILINQFIHGMTAFDTTLCQLSAAAVVMLPYVWLTTPPHHITWQAGTIALVLFVGIVHTGITYLLFFSAVGNLPAQTTAVFSYIDPVTAIILSALVLHQPLTGIQIVGAVLILGATLLNEWYAGRKKT